MSLLTEAAQYREREAPNLLPALTLMFRAPLSAVRYRSASEGAAMAKQTETVSWDLFKWVVGGLIALLVLVSGGGLTLLVSNVSEVKTDVRSIQKELSDTRTDLKTAISDTRTDLKTAIATTNGKLDILIDETRKRR